ncbi:MAG: glutamine synthetase III [Candidatus Microthrix sp.]|uniref:Glutamine synthetase III n=1 Tax=Candidatus Neomicrothrix subdominans TaxID=2954438 RepID=A0A936TG92_9ACTN|nr:glutamine synthetase III [Candidatus Microthrix subdominans]
MSGRAVRTQALAATTSRPSAIHPGSGIETPAELFGRNVFTKAVMQSRLPKAVYESLQATVNEGIRLDPSVADVVASAMKDWATEHGASYYAHVFYPLTGLSAEKHDSFLDTDGAGLAISNFSGGSLVQGEPDASSFPSGGIRETFEARGYTAWDVTSPAYILENPNGNTLCIPTAFVSWTGEALDKKTPVLRSQQALNVQAQRMLRLFGVEDPSRVASIAGAEQEYFLIDRNFYFARPDLMSTGRTLMGAQPPKGQEFDDHYFGAIPERVLTFMLDAEREMLKLGIPTKTRHNEVAPGQYELAPIHEEGNVAADHQQLVMSTLSRVAHRHGLVCLHHEKPFAGVNGSGKHINWSLGNAEQGNLLNPGDTPHENAQFLVFCAAVIRGVDKHADVMRAAIATAANDHRLGANEAPPAIMSVFLGDQLHDVFEQVAQGGGASSSKVHGTLRVGADTLPQLPKDPGDRNRTSPFAFTGNRFEFRAVGSSQSISGPLVVLNSIMADSLDYMATQIEQAVAFGSEFNEAVEDVLRDVMVKHGRVIFNGDGYSDEWQDEAARRGLPNLKATPEALSVYETKEAQELFDRLDVLTPRELHSRYEAYMGQYVMSISVEARSTLEMARTLIYPSVKRFQANLAGTENELVALGLGGDTETLTRVTELVTELTCAVAPLAQAIDGLPDAAPIGEQATYCRETILPAMNAVRAATDLLEEIVDDELWPLLTYQEMLFIK